MDSDLFLTPYKFSLGVIGSPLGLPGPEELVPTPKQRHLNLLRTQHEAYNIYAHALTTMG